MPSCATGVITNEEFDREKAKILAAPGRNRLASVRVRKSCGWERAGPGPGPQGTLNVNPGDSIVDYAPMFDAPAGTPPPTGCTVNPL